MWDRSRAIARTLRGITRTIRRRTGEAKKEALALTANTGELLDKEEEKKTKEKKVGS